MEMEPWSKSSISDLQQWYSECFFRIWNWVSWDCKVTREQAAFMENVSTAWQMFSMVQQLSGKKNKPDQRQTSNKSSYYIFGKGI